MRIELARRTVLKAGAALAAPAIILRPGWAATGPIKLAAITPLTGQGAQYGQMEMMAMQFAAEKVNRAGGLLGREVKIVGLDYDLKTDVGVRRVREALLVEKADAITAWTGAVTLVAAQAAAKEGKFFASPSNVPAEITGEQFQRTSYVGSLSTSHTGAAMASFAAKSPLKDIYLFNPDNANGHALADGFKKRFAKVRRPDQRIVAEEYFPIFSISDFGPYVTKIDSKGPCLLVTMAYGADLRNLMQQGHSLAWRQKVLSWGLADPALSAAIGDALVGHYHLSNVMMTCDTPLMNAFIKEWTTRYPDITDPMLKYPENIIVRAHYWWLWFMDAVKRAGSLEAGAVAKAFEGASFDMPWGKVTMRACDHQTVSPAWWAEVVKPSEIPKNLRFYGDLPYTGKATQIPVNEIFPDQSDSTNPRCRA